MKSITLPVSVNEPELLFFALGGQEQVSTTLPVYSGHRCHCRADSACESGDDPRSRKSSRASQTPDWVQNVDSLTNFLKSTWGLFKGFWQGSILDLSCRPGPLEKDMDEFLCRGVCK